MILILRKDTHPERVEQLCEHLEGLGLTPNPILEDGITIIGVVGDTSAIEPEGLELLEGVERVIRLQEPFLRANRKFHPEDTLIQVGDAVIGGQQIIMAAGPCSVESQPQLNEIAQAVKASGAQLLRGGAFKPRTSPYAFQGLRAEGLLYMQEAARQSGLTTASEITSPSQLQQFIDHVDILQVGARNMQNFELLKELGRTNKPILLKRGFANTLQELLMAAEYILSGGNEQVILCERGIRTFETATRNTLDISAIPMLKQMSHLPVFVDPSHAGGIAWLVEPLALAAVAAGADGLIIEVHSDPMSALSDRQQALTPPQFDSLLHKLRLVATAVGRTM